MLLTTAGWMATMAAEEIGQKRRRNTIWVELLHRSVSALWWTRRLSCALCGLLVNMLLLLHTNSSFTVDYLYLRRSSLEQDCLSVCSSSVGSMVIIISIWPTFSSKLLTLLTSRDHSTDLLDVNLFARCSSVCQSSTHCNLPLILWSPSNPSAQL